MRPVVSLRWSAVVVVLLVTLVVVVVMSAAVPAPAGGGVGAVGGGLGERSVVRAVARTRAAGSARVVGRFTPSSGPPVLLEGRTSLVGAASSVTARAGPGGAVASEVRVVADGRAWVRVAGSSSWTSVDPAAVALVAGARGWGDLLGRIVAVGPPVDGAVPATVDGAPARLWLDGDGRISRLRMGRAGGGTLDVRLLDFGTEVDVVPP